MTHPTDSPCPARPAKKSHCFPVFDRESISDLELRHERCGTFKPLYRFSAQDGDSSVSEEYQATMDRIRQEGFQRGSDAGRQNACDLVQAEAAPDIKAFTLEFRNLINFLARTEDHTCQNILSMAIAIAEKILGQTAHLKPENLDSLGIELKKQMALAYRLDLILNPEDREMLSRVLSCEITETPTVPSINISEDGQSQRGSLKTAESAAAFFASDGLIDSLDRILADVST